MLVSIQETRCTKHAPATARENQTACRSASQGLGELLRLHSVKSLKIDHHTDGKQHDAHPALSPQRIGLGHKTPQKTCHSLWQAATGCDQCCGLNVAGLLDFVFHSSVVVVPLGEKHHTSWTQKAALRAFGTFNMLNAWASSRLGSHRLAPRNSIGCSRHSVLGGRQTKCSFVAQRRFVRSVQSAAHARPNSTTVPPGEIGQQTGRAGAEECVYGPQKEAFVGPVAVQAVPGGLSRQMQPAAVSLVVGDPGVCWRLA